MIDCNGGGIRICPKGGYKHEKIFYKSTRIKVPCHNMKLN